MGDVVSSSFTLYSSIDPKISTSLSVCVLTGGGDLLQDQHQLHRPARPHGSAHRHREREPGDHRAPAGLQRVRRRRPSARHPQGGGGSRGAAAKSQEAKRRHAG